MGGVKQQVRAVERPPSFEDQLQREAEMQAGLAIGEWLMGQNYHRPISALTRIDLARMAAAAIGKWIIVRTEQERGTRDQSANPLDGG